MALLTPSAPIKHQNQPGSPCTHLRKQSSKDSGIPHGALQLSPLPGIHTTAPSTRTYILQDLKDKTKKPNFSNPLGGSSIISSLSFASMGKPAAFCLHGDPPQLNGPFSHSEIATKMETNATYTSLDPTQMFPPQGLVPLERGILKGNSGTWSPRMPSAPSPMLSVLSCILSLRIHFNGKKEALADPWRKRILFIGRKVLINSFFWHLTFQRVGQRREMTFISGF